MKQSPLEFNYNKVSFNAEHIASLTVEQFLAENMAKHLPGHTDEMKEEQLRMVHAECVKIVNESKGSDVPAPVVAEEKGKVKGKGDK